MSFLRACSTSWRRVVPGLLFLLGQAQTPDSVAASEASGPVLIHNRVADFGSVIQGDTAWADFKVENVSEKSVPISVRSNGCGCLGASRQILPPGSTEKLTVRLLTDDLEGFVRRSVVLEVEGWSETPNLVIQGKVLQPYRVVPRAILLDPSHEGPVLFEIHGPVLFEIDAFSTDLAVEQIEWEPIPGKENRLHRVQLQLDEATPLEQRGQITFRLVSTFGIHEVQLLVMPSKTTPQSIPSKDRQTMTMTLEEALAQLESRGHEKVRGQNRKHGAGDPQSGVRLGDIRK